MSSDDNIIQQEADILAEIEVSEPRISEVVSPLSLLPEYENAELPGFVPGIKYIAAKYDGMRRVRRDGNCFYRGFLFAYFEELLINLRSSDTDAAQLSKKELDRFTTAIVNSKQELIGIGYDEFAFECFHDAFVELLELCAGPGMAFTILSFDY